MKKIITFLLIIFTTILFAQKLEKIKGNKNVVLAEVTLDTITSLELYKNIDLVLVSGKENKLEIYADDNLHEIIDVDMHEGKLSLSLLYRISTKKKFELTLHLTNLEEIVLNGNSKLTNKDYFNSDNIHIVLNDKSDAELLIDATSIEFEGNDKSDAKVSFKADNVTYILNESASLKGDVKADDQKINMEDRAVITLNGKCQNLTVEANGNAKVKLTNLIASDANIKAEDRADVYANTTKNLTIEAIDASKLYIYGNATINLKEFKGKAVLNKKE